MTQKRIATPQEPVGAVAKVIGSATVERACQNCAAYSKDNRCHRGPAQLTTSVVGEVIFAFPPMKPTDWCLEFIPR